MSGKAIELNHVRYETKHFTLEDIHFDVPKGYVTGFIGANGSGKTTTIRMIMDLLQPTAGDIKLFGQPMQADPVDLKDKIGFVYSELYLNDKWKVKKAEKLIAPFYSQWDHELFMDYLKRFELPYDKKIRELSTGMKMKLSLAIALSHHAELYIFDEPTAGLDPVVRNEILDIIQEELLDEQKSVFFSTHIISDLERIADYIVHLQDGHIIVNGSKEELLETHHLVRGDSADLDDELRQLLIHCVEKEDVYSGMTKDAQTFHELFGQRVTISPMTVEEIMVHYEQHKKGVMNHDNTH
ncbi:MULTISPECIES: ABC transporter ATP-binding protein [unclassified Staphylococcus]|uniref:phenol-soluble modulin export ABC transporter ATP-binding protein PmtA n=1 Tax=unclassified Staphylococcus TaxID=91994 RepID=UPI0021CE90E0|nr:MULTISPECIES: ABC transporter ATP-binding protein [unclassified Staphylococcus]UXR77792.1 ABC transporter ATP-binding protein [Staphylococcus sp. IVB6227]UXR81951.1 ABC transporter ATP-binding protein [Staphylococcus sp. IVB6214]